MNVYVLSPEAKDAELVVNRLTDREVSNVADEDGEPIFRMYPNACEFDKETYTWKSNMGKTFIRRWKKLKRILYQNFLYIHKPPPTGRGITFHADPVGVGFGNLSARVS